jgi:hypothetical protein
VLASFLKRDESEGLGPSWGLSRNGIGINDFQTPRTPDVARLPQPRAKSIRALFDKRATPCLCHLAHNTCHEGVRCRPRVGRNRHSRSPLGTELV